MKLTSSQIKIMQEDMYADLIQLLIEKHGYTVEKAMDILYNSDTFARLQDANTGLYYQSPGYVYSFLNNELCLCDYRI
jgi:hypothetical protein